MTGGTGTLRPVVLKRASLHLHTCCRLCLEGDVPHMQHACHHSIADSPLQCRPDWSHWLDRSVSLVSQNSPTMQPPYLHIGCMQCA